MIEHNLSFIFLDSNWLSNSTGELVADSNNNRIQYFPSESTTGTILTTSWTSSGSL